MCWLPLSCGLQAASWAQPWAQASLPQAASWVQPWAQASLAQASWLQAASWVQPSAQASFLAPSSSLLQPTNEEARLGLGGLWRCFWLLLEFRTWPGGGHCISQHSTAQHSPAQPCPAQPSTGSTFTQKHRQPIHTAAYLCRSTAQHSSHTAQHSRVVNSTGSTFSQQHIYRVAQQRTALT